MCVCVPVCALMCVSMVQKRSFSLPETTVYLCVCVCVLCTHAHTRLNAVSKKHSDVCVFQITSLCIYTCASISPHLHALQYNYASIQSRCVGVCECVSVCVCVALAHRNAGLPVGLGDLLGGHIK